MPGDNDQMMPGLSEEFGSGVIGVCDVCGTRQAVIVLQKERFKLCVLDFLNKTWTKPGLTPGAPLPTYRSERVWYPTDATPTGKAPAIMLSPTKVVKHPIALVTPEVYGLTTTMLDLGIRLAREGCEVLLPDVARSGIVGPRAHAGLRFAARFRGGVSFDHPEVQRLRRLYLDALRFLRARDMVDPEKTVVAGAGYGAALAEAVAVEDRSVTALVLAYPVPVRPAEFLKVIAAPVLFVDAGGDAWSRRARAQWEALGPAAEVGVRFLDMPGAKAYFLARDLGQYDVDLAERAWSEIAQFVKTRLFPAPPRPPTPPTVSPTATPPPAVPARPAGAASAPAKPASPSAPTAPGPSTAGG